MPASPNLGLSYLEASQSQKHVTLNEALRRIDAVVSVSVVDRDLATPPASPADGARYLVAAAPTGAWSGQTGKLAAFQDGAWAFYPVPDGTRVYVLDEQRLLVRSSSGFVDATSVLQNLSMLGVGTSADATNPLSFKGPNLLLAALPAAEGGSGDIRLKLNKESAAKTLSLLLQSGWSGRAELGLTGDDRFRLKVSADGSLWNDVFEVEPATGAATFASGAARSQKWIFTASGTWTKPAWAKMIRVVAIGGGGGGGGGATRGAGVANGGGAGGTAGCVASEIFDSTDVPSSVSITIGAGGTAGAGATGVDGNGGAGGAGGTTLFGSLLEGKGSSGGGGGTASGGAAGTSFAYQSTLNVNVAGGAGGSGVAGSVGSATACSPGSGGGGGGVSSADATAAGGTGNGGYLQGTASTEAPAVAGGSAAGGNGTAGNAQPVSWSFGAGGGGGASAVICGAGGGGGGATRNGFTAGSGGTGARGELRIYAYG